MVRSSLALLVFRSIWVPSHQFVFFPLLGFLLVRFGLESLQPLTLMAASYGTCGTGFGLQMDVSAIWAFHLMSEAKLGVGTQGLP